MRISLLALTLITLIALGFVFSSCYQQLPVKMPDPKAPNFPFTSIGQMESIIFIDPAFYNQKNLESLFLWHYEKYLHKGGAPAMLVFTDKQLMDAYIEDHRRPIEMEAPTDLRTPSSLSPPKYPRNVLFDAEFSQTPSESILKKGEELSSSGFNVEYSFVPDLTQPGIRKKVVLRGSTWTEGKYNIENQELDWATGRISVTAYDLYNVEPSSRYYTFGYKTKHSGYVRPYEKTRVIFNLHQSDLVPPPVKQVKILNESVAYVYMGWMYSVSLDGGQTWHLWDAERNIPEWKCCDPGLIREVSISDQGSGVMTLRLDPNKPESQVYLRTTDFGQHWLKD